jgi:hypothetical protein
MMCPGDPTSVCGGPNRLSLYGTSTTPPTYTPESHPAVSTTTYAGCWTETSPVRALSGASAYSGTLMTIEACGDYCLNEGFTWFGLEYTAECYCGSGLSEESVSAEDTDCAMPCSGASGEVCGGPNRISVYQWV